MVKKIQEMSTDDFVNLEFVADKYRSDISVDSESRVKSYYSNFVAVVGDPWRIPPSNLNDSSQKKLKDLYKQPIKKLSFIKEARRSSPEVCSMCGSAGTFNLDHYLPQENYAAFAIFSKNLVPACDCNIKRKTKLLGENRPARVIHPMYDTFADDRLYMVKFDGNCPTLALDVVLVDSNHPAKEILAYHKEAVLDGSQMLTWLDSRWGGYVQKPKAKFGDFMGNASNVSLADFQRGLENFEYRKTMREFETPNNWESMLLYGILNDQSVLSWLANHYNNSPN